MYMYEYMKMYVGMESRTVSIPHALTSDKLKYI